MRGRMVSNVSWERFRVQIASLCCHWLLWAHVAHGERPTIRIAHFHYHQTDSSFVPVQFLLDYFVNSSTPRTILPDYDVVIDPVEVEPSTGDASVQLLGRLLSRQPYHAFTGPKSTVDCADIVDLSAHARITHVTRGENAEFSSQRERYPYAFRTARSLDPLVNSYMYIVASNSWHTILSIWSQGAEIDLASIHARRYNVTNLALLADFGEEWLVQAWQGNAVDIIRQDRTRVVFAFLPTTEDMYRFSCHVHRQQISMLQYFAPNVYESGWFLKNFSTELGDCSSEEMLSAVGGYITASHVAAAPGVTVAVAQGDGGLLQGTGLQRPGDLEPGQSAGGTHIPVLPGMEDESRKKLTCLPDLTAQDIYTSFEIVIRGFISGVVATAGEAQFFTGSSAPEMDMVCATLLALHDALYNKGVRLQQLEDREQQAFETVIDSLSKVELQGTAGPFKFYPNSGDPEVIYYMLTQPGRPGIPASLNKLLGTISFPDGLLGIPSIQLLDEELPILWRDGSSGLGPKPHLELFPLCSEQNAELVWGECRNCTPGRAYDRLLDACRTCASGDYQSEPGMSTCMTALPGLYVSNTSVPTEATECPRGHECPQIGTVTPQRCARGRFANSTGFSSCFLCPVGTYQDAFGSTACSMCEEVLAGSTTANIASTASSQCICPAGTFRLTSGNNQTQCAKCLEGLLCPQGSDMSSVDTYPLVEPGYMTLASSPLTVYRCKVEEQCPGGPPGSCANHRDPLTVACGECTTEAYEAGDVCEACGGSAALPLLIAAVVSVTLIVAATVAINKDVHKTPAASFMIVAITGMLFTSMQALGVFNQMSIPWSEPVRTILRLSQVLSFDLKLLKVSCVVGVNPVRTFAMRQVVPVMAIPFVALTLLVKKLNPWRRSKKRTRLLVELTNAVGSIYSLFFIAILLSAVNPFLCYQHPGDSGESVLSAPSLLCFDSDDHTAMVTVGALALLLVPVPFLGLCGYGSWMYPSHMRSHDSSEFLHAMRFLFFRFTPHRYYFQCILLSRSALLCIIPAILRGQPSTQVLFMVIVLTVYVALEATMQPWRAKLCNPLDSAMNIMLLVMLVCGALFLEDTPQKDIVAMLATGTCVFLLILALAGIAVAIKRRLVPSPFYDYFICHHKADAAAQARYMKTMIQAKRAAAQVFIDSDNLQQLDMLFDTVKSRVGKLVVYLTSETLKRPWCCGEIVSAFRASLTIIRLHTPSFVAPTEEQIANPEHYIHAVGCNLGEYHIQWSDITEAYQRFLTTGTHVEMSQKALGTHRFALAAAEILKQRLGDVTVAPLNSVPDCSVLVLSDANSDEASASAGILLARISKDIFQVCGISPCLMTNFAFDLEAGMRLSQKTYATVVILSQGCMDDMHFVTMMCEIQRSQGRSSSPALVSVNTPGFIFPAPDFIETVCATAGIQAMFGEDAAEYVKTFFKSISILLPTHASQDVLDTQSDEIFKRVKGQLAGSRTGSRATPTSPMSGNGMRLASKGSSAIGYNINYESMDSQTNDAWAQWV